MLGKLTLAVIALAATTSVAAHPESVLARTVPLQDGSSVYIFKDGKMGMEDRLGRVVSMPEGHIMQTRDGQSIKMVGNETAVLDCFLKTRLGGGR